MYFTARINSFITDKSITVKDVLKKFSVIDGLTHVDLNYPEHFKNIPVDEMKQILQEKRILLPRWISIQNIKRWFGMECQ